MVYFRSLAYTQLRIDTDLLRFWNISYLNLTGIRSEVIDFKAINDLKSLKYIVYNHFYYCSMTPNVLLCKPNTDGLSTFRDLLGKPILRYTTWSMGFLTIFGNIMVLWGRFIYRDENRAVTMVIRNLAVADIMMGFYLIVIGVLDHYFRHQYHT